METLIGQNGGSAVFGSWASWGDTWALEEEQARRTHTESTHTDVLKILEREVADGTATQRVTVREVVNLKALKARFASEGDSMESLVKLERYIKRVEAEGRPWADVPVGTPNADAHFEIHVMHANTNKYGR